MSLFGIAVAEGNVRICSQRRRGAALLDAWPRGCPSLSPPHERTCAFISGLVTQQQLRASPPVRGALFLWTRRLRQAAPHAFQCLATVARLALLFLYFRTGPPAPLTLLRIASAERHFTI